MGLVRLYGTLRPRVGGEGVVDVPWSPGDTIADVIRELLRRKPGLQGHILDGEGQLLPYVNVFLNGRDIRHLNGLESRVDRDTELFIFPPVAGGQTPAPVWAADDSGPALARLGAQGESGVRYNRNRRYESQMQEKKLALQELQQRIQHVLHRL